MVTQAEVDADYLAEEICRLLDDCSAPYEDPTIELIRLAIVHRLTSILDGLK